MKYDKEKELILLLNDCGGVAKQALIRPRLEKLTETMDSLFVLCNGTLFNKFSYILHAVLKEKSDKGEMLNQTFSEITAKGVEFDLVAKANEMKKQIKYLLVLITNDDGISREHVKDIMVQFKTEHELEMARLKQALKDEAIQMLSGEQISKTKSESYKILTDINSRGLKPY